MTEAPFTNREITKMLDDQSRDLKRHMTGLIEPLTEQVKYTNGKMKKLTFYLTIVASVTATLFAMNGSEVFSVLKLFI